MKPTSATLRYVENTVKGYCDIHKFKVVARHDTDYEGTVIYSRFRVNNDPCNDVSIKWPNVTDVSATIDSVCDAIFRNVTKNRYSNIDISHEMNLLAYCSAQINKKPAPTLEISKVVFNPPCTIVLWSDKTKTIVRCQEGDVFDPEKGLAMAIVKKTFGNTGKYCDIFKKWVPEEKNPRYEPTQPLSFEQLSEAASRTTKSVQEFLNSLSGSLLTPVEKKGE